MQEVFQWHEDGISLPPEVDVLASSPASPVQAFRHGEHVYGLQFHLEVNRPLIERWLTVPAHRATLEEERGRVDPDAIRRQTETSIGPLDVWNVACVMGRTLATCLSPAPLNRSPTTGRATSDVH